MEIGSVWGFFVYSFRLAQARKRFVGEIEFVPKMIRFRHDIRFKKFFAENEGIYEIEYRSGPVRWRQVGMDVYGVWIHG